MWYGVRGHGEEEPFSLWFCPVRKLMLSVSDRGTDHREDRAMSFVAVAVGALAVASATYLIFDLSGPYSGIFRASSGRSNRCWRGVVTSTWIGAARGLEGALTSGRGGGSPRPERFVS
jgi:hypothetical protein